MRIVVPHDDPGGAPEHGRYHRQSLLPWWDQDRVSRAHVLVIGAGALGCEVIKCLALMGVGSVLVYDMDAIERSNLSRSALFRDADVGRGKAETAVRAARELNPGVAASFRAENAVHRAGLGVFAWADVVIGCVDNREARVFVNSACARTGRAWVDGAIEGLSGIVRAFDPSRGPCYECTMNDTDRRMLAVRRSCALLARDVADRGHVPTTAVAASIVGALEAQEALKILHGQPALEGEGLHLDGAWRDVSRVRYPRRDGCPGHDSLGKLIPTGFRSRDTTLGAVIDRAEREFGAGAAVDVSRDLVVSLTCPACGDVAAGGTALGAVREADAACPRCGTHRIVDTAASFGRDGPAALDRTLAELGVPPLDVLVARRGMEASAAWLVDGDAPEVLGVLADRPGGTA